MEREFDFEKPILEIQKEIEKLKLLQTQDKGDYHRQIAELQKKSELKGKEIYDSLSPWEIVQVARHPQRPVLYDYTSLIFDDFLELHGDRCFGDDHALIGGFAMLDKQKVMLIGHSKGKNVEENVARNFGMARPEGYRKALRLMRLAQKYNIPIITFIDTPGAYPGLDAEERGQAEAIARNLVEMARIEVPIVSLVTGEGGSGGALGIGVSDIILMLSNAVYSVISPEGCASILWRDAAYSPEAAKALRITAPELLKMGVIDRVIPEPPCGAHRDHEQTALAVKNTLLKYLKKLTSISSNKLISKRFQKFCAMGEFNK